MYLQPGFVGEKRNADLCILVFDINKSIFSITLDETRIKLSYCVSQQILLILFVVPSSFWNRKKSCLGFYVEESDKMCYSDVELELLDTSIEKIAVYRIIQTETAEQGGLR